MCEENCCAGCTACMPTESKCPVCNCSPCICTKPKEKTTKKKTKKK